MSHPPRSITTNISLLHSLGKSSIVDHLSTEEIATRLDCTLLPIHVAIIMDGNGRWAKERAAVRTVGHREGIKSLREVIETCLELGIKNLTIFAFSQENWNRPTHEITALMDLFEYYLSTEQIQLIKQGIRFHTIGHIEALPATVVQFIRDTEQATAHLNKLHLTIAINYSGRTEIVDAICKIIGKVNSGTLRPEEVNESQVQQHLYAPDCPDPDFLIRTSGETRVSNFLLWQLAYCELYFTPTLWPDFHRREFLLALLEYQHRDRRFGCTLTSTAT